MKKFGTNTAERLLAQLRCRYWYFFDYFFSD